jgi:hypothetical protein
VPTTIVTAAYALLCFFGGFGAGRCCGAPVWEPVVRDAGRGAGDDSRAAPRRGLWTFGGVVGISWFVGNVALGSLYDFRFPAAMWLAVVAQLRAIAPLLMAANYLHAQIKPPPRPHRCEKTAADAIRGARGR